VTSHRDVLDLALVTVTGLSLTSHRDVVDLALVTVTVAWWPSG